MDFFLDNDNLISVLKICGQFFAVWPLTPKDGIFQHLFYRVMWWIYFLNFLYMLSGNIIGIYCCHSNLVNLMKSLVEIIYILEAAFNLIYCRLKKLELQHLIQDMERFNATAAPYALALKRNCLRRTLIVYTVLPMIFVVGALIFVFSPLVMANRIVPLNTVYYGLPLEKDWGIPVTYALNILAIVQATVAIIVDLIAVAILWHCTYKFSIIGTRMEALLNGCLRETIMLHQAAISYAKEIDSIISPIVVKSTAAIVMYIITCSLLVLSNVPIFELTQFFLITFLSGLRLFVCSWSAEVMSAAAYEVCRTVYAAPWIDASRKTRKNVLIIIERCQKPTIVHASGIIPVLSLSFCGWVLYKTLSYFLTLRAILHI